MRVALVTGAARGIGAAVVRTLVDRGYVVAALDACQRADGPAGVDYALASPEELASVVAERPDRVHGFTADVRDASALKAVVSEVVRRFGRIDAAVACAGVVIGGTSAWDLPSEHLRTMLEVNTVGVWNTSAAVIPAMLSGPDPATCRFVAVASAAGEQGLFHLAGYSASKHAVIGIVRGLAADLVGTGVTAVAVSPGATRTDMLTATARIYGTEVDELVERQGLRRRIEPEEIAAVVALCCSAEGAVLNGSVVRADGGFRG